MCARAEWNGRGATQLYYQDYLGKNPILTMVRLLPMAITGVLCNVIVALFVGRVPLVYLICTSRC